MNNITGEHYDEWTSNYMFANIFISQKAIMNNKIFLTQQPEE